jgi:hypothetical protein
MASGYCLENSQTNAIAAVTFVSENAFKVLV